MPEKGTNDSQHAAFPELSDDALSGLAGDFVRSFVTHTEIHPVSLLLTFLVMFGSACGRSPHAWVDETRHGVNLAAVLVGTSSRSRKGQSEGPNRRIFSIADKHWIDNRTINGLGSGEGLVWQIRDPSEKTDKDGNPIDPGVTDKRLLVLEQELASYFAVAGRDGSTASAQFRKAWDSLPSLGNMVKRDPVKASNPHVSFLGHITVDELRRVLTETDRANGVGNRFLWALVRRSKVIADPPRVSDQIGNDLGRRTREALECARRTTEIKRDKATAELWKHVYPALTHDYPGVFGTLIARAEAHVLRLSLIYALLDCSSLVKPKHLAAALALWNYCEQSTRAIFGDRTGDPVADRILDALRSDGELTESAMHDLFGRNQKANRIAQALGLLRTHNLAMLETRQTNGRPARIWTATK